MQISKKIISNDVFLKLFKILREVFHTNLSEENFAKLISELFSIKEQIMIVKRLAIIYLVVKGHGVNEIAKVLKVSSGTSSKFSDNASERKFLTNFFSKKMSKEKVLNFLDDFYHEVLSPPTKYGTDWAAGWKIEIERQKRKKQDI